MEWTQLVEAVQALGVLGLLSLAIVGAYRRWYVMRPEYEDLRRDRDEWKQMALEAITAARQATTVASEAVK